MSNHICTFLHFLTLFIINKNLYKKFYSQVISTFVDNIPKKNISCIIKHSFGGVYMGKIEDIYEFILKTKFEYWLEDTIKDIKIIEFAILCQDVMYKTNVYNKMLDKYAYYLDKIGYGKATDIMSKNYSLKNLSEESLVRNSLSMLRKWIIRCSGYMCIRKISEENISDGVDIYMKKYSLNEEVADVYTLEDKLEIIDNEILNFLRESV